MFGLIPTASNYSEHFTSTVSSVTSSLGFLICNTRKFIGIMPLKTYFTPQFVLGIEYVFIILNRV